MGLNSDTLYLCSLDTDSIFFYLHWKQELVFINIIYIHSLPERYSEFIADRYQFQCNLWEYELCFLTVTVHETKATVLSVSVIYLLLRTILIPHLQ